MKILDIIFFTGDSAEEKFLFKVKNYYRALLGGIRYKIAILTDFFKNDRV